MMPTLGWKVWTSDSVYNSVEHPASEIPPDVQVVVYYHPHPYRTMDSGEDYYQVDGVTLVGKEIPYEDFLAIQAQAFEDMEWPE
jgi:hypothetical protein